MVERESPTRGQEQILRVVWEDIRRRLLFGAAWWSKAVLKKWASPDAASINFAAKAKDLQEIRDAMVTAAGVSAGLWLSYLFVLFYFLVAAGGVTHKDLFLENAVKLPFLNIDLPLRGFFWLGPLIFLVVHTYVLLHFRLLAVKVRIFDNELHAQIDSGQEDSVTRTSLRYQLPNDIFVQFLAGARETRTGLTGWLLEGIAWISLVIGPVALLVFFQLQFLPYHEVRITWLQRVVVWLDLLLLWRIWSEIVPSAATTFTLSVVTLITLYVVFLIATFPGEWLEIPAIPGRKDLVAGDVNLVTRKPDSFWSNRLVLPGFDVIDHSKFDNEAKIGVLPVTASLRARNLRGAVLIGAVLRKVDFTAADLQGAWLDGAQLQGTSLDEAQLQGASLDRANLQGAHLIGANLTSATLIDADLTVLRSALSGEDQRIGVGAERRESEWKADLSGANLTAANLDGAHLDSSALIYADMTQADLTGATLEKADLTGANLIYTRFNNAHLDETIMNKVCLAGASLPNAILKKAHLIRAELFSPDQQKNGDDLTDADLTGADLTNANLAHALFGESDFKQANLAHANLNGAHLSQARHVSEEQLKEGCGKTDDLPSGLNLGTCSTPQNDPDEGRGPEQAAAAICKPIKLAKNHYVFALVPSSPHNPFFDQARDGCKEAEKKLNMAAVGTADDEGAECEYVGPGEHGNQVQVVNYLIDRLHVAGIGISPADPKDEKMEAALKRAKNEGIPVLTWDSDLQDKKLRKAYIGSDNYQMGVDLAKLVMEIKPSGGTIFIELGSDTSANHKERLKGIRDTLSGKGKKRATEDAPLKDENGWTEVDRPFYPEDSSITVRQVGEIRGENPNLQAVRKMDEILGKYPNLDAFVATGGFPEQLEREYKKVAGSIKSKIGSAPAAGHQLAAFKSGNESKLALVFGDTLPMQIYELKSGLASGNVGQRPFDMGYKVMYALKKIKDGKGPPSDPTYTELDICTSENVKTCIGRHR